MNSGACWGGGGGSNLFQVAARRLALWASGASGTGSGHAGGGKNALTGTSSWASAGLGQAKWRRRAPWVSTGRPLTGGRVNWALPATGRAWGVLGAATPGTGGG